MKLSKDKIKLCMARKMLSMSELAEKSGVPVQTILTACRRGSCKPATAGMIANALEVDITEILEVS